MKNRPTPSPIALLTSQIVDGLLALLHIGNVLGKTDQLALALGGLEAQQLGQPATVATVLNDAHLESFSVFPPKVFVLAWGFGPWGGGNRDLATKAVRKATVVCAPTAGTVAAKWW